MKDNQLSTTIFKLRCPKCKQITPHLVLQINRKHGIKLKCAHCDNPTQYRNLDKLKEWNKA